MTDDKELQKAIDHANQMERVYRWTDPDRACDHAQIAEWLEELQGRRAKMGSMKEADKWR